jgi:FMN phosphatase YigB (HAD superfamily)
MPLVKKGIKAIVFDYGNTLIEFGRMQIALCDTALATALEKHFGRLDRDKFNAMRLKNRLAPYAGDPPQYRENNLVDISTNLVRDLYGLEPSPEQLADILRVRFDIFVRVVRAPDYVFDLLDKLGRKYRLGLLSNYPDGNAIRQTLVNTGLLKYFHAVVVSGDLGLVKPHPVPFLTVLDQLGASPARAVSVGDNWLADVQGAKRSGLQAVWMTQWENPEQFSRRPGDFEPDAVITHLSDLESLLL